jgi:hypothetical protein
MTFDNTFLPSVIAAEVSSQEVSIDSIFINSNDKIQITNVKSNPKFK